MNEPHQHILALAAQIVTAQVRHNDIQSHAIPSLILNVYNALKDADETNSVVPRQVMKTIDSNFHSDHHHVGNHAHVNNVYEHPVFGQTVFDDRLVCMEDGLSMKMLKRHLLTVHGMTPADYRAKWDLPDEYPMVASSYAKLRSSLALESGLGLKPDARSGKRRKSR